MLIVPEGDDLHVVSDPILQEKKNKKNVISLLSVEFTYSVVNVNTMSVNEKNHSVFLIHMANIC